MSGMTRGVRATLAVLVMLLVAGFAAATAMAESTVTACLPYVKTTGKLATGKPIVAGTETGTCKDTTAIHYHSLNIPEAGGFEKLNKLLSHVTFNESGVGGKPTVQFSGVNVQIINGPCITVGLRDESGPGTVITLCQDGNAPFGAAKK